MTATQKNLFLFAIATLFLVNLTHLHGMCDLGDDFAQYIIHAQNIAAFKPYTQGIDLEPNVIYPPGLPLILAPLVKVFGSYSTALKVPNVFFYFGAIFFLFHLFKKHMAASTAYWLCLLLASSSLFFFFKQHVLSDIPFLFWVSASLVMAQKYEDRPDGFRRWDWFWLFLCFSMAMLTRSMGAALFLAGILHWGVFRKNIRTAVLLAITFTGVFIGQSWVLQGVHSDNFNIILRNLSHYAPIILHNIPVIAKSLVYIIYPNIPILNASSGPAHHIINVITYLSYAAFILYLLTRLMKKTLSFSDIFLGIYFAALVFWTAVPGGVNEFNRYVWPIIGPALILLFKGLNDIKNKFSVTNFPHRSRVFRAFFLILIVLNLLFIKKTYHYNNYFQADTANIELIDWMKIHTKKTDHYLFFKPRLLAYLTRRIGTGWGDGHLTEDRLIEKLQRLNIGYLITVKELESEIISYLESRPDLYTPVWNNKSYKIFKVL